MSPTPFSLEAEQGLLSCCLLDGLDVITRCLTAGVDARSFHEPKHRLVFASALALAHRQSQPDAALVAEHLAACGQLEAAGGYSFLAEITRLIPTTAHAGEFIARVSALARQRTLLAATAAAHEAAGQNATDWAELWDRVEPHLRAAQEPAVLTGRRSLADIAKQAREWRLDPDSRPTTPTPWPSWDKEARAPRAGELIVIGGRPGTGKTSLAGNIAHDLAASGRRVAFFTLEMSSEELVDRFAMRRAGRDGIGEDRHANRAVAAQIEEVAKLSGLQLFESGDILGMAQIEASCRLLAAGPGGLAAVVVDYLQLVPTDPAAKGEVREQQVSALTRRFKLLARSLACPVFLLAQLNRESEKDERRPRLSDLRESGAIEQDADRVWFLYQPRPAPNAPLVPEDATQIDVALYQCKCRNGPPGVEGVLHFHRPLFSFTT